MIGTLLPILWWLVLITGTLWMAVSFMPILPSRGGAAPGERIPWQLMIVGAMGIALMNVIPGLANGMRLGGSLLAAGLIVYGANRLPKPAP